MAALKRTKKALHAELSVTLLTGTGRGFLLHDRISLDLKKIKK